MDKNKPIKKKTKAACSTSDDTKPAEPNAAPEYEIKKVEGFSFKNFSENSSK
jgi:hypothetical protein